MAAMNKNGTTLPQSLHTPYTKGELPQASVAFSSYKLPLLGTVGALVAPV